MRIVYVNLVASWFIQSDNKLFQRREKYLVGRKKKTPESMLRAVRCSTASTKIREYSMCVVCVKCECTISTELIVQIMEAD